MSSVENEVRPGDLITADLMNRVLARLRSLEDKVRALEEDVVGTDMAITDVTPSGTLHVSDTVKVLGYGFAPIATSNIVTIGGITIEQFQQGNSDKLLIFTVPANIPGIPRDDVVITVRRGTKVASRIVSVAPAVVIPHGVLKITDITASVQAPGQITVGGTYYFWFKLDSQTLPGGESYRLTPVFSSPQGASAAAWSAEARLVQANKQPLTTNPIGIEPGSPLTVGIETKVPPGATSISIALAAESLHNPAQLDKSSSTIPIVVGQAPENPSSDITFNLEPFGEASSGRIVKEGSASIIEIPFGGTATVKWGISVKSAGSYQFDVTADSLAGVWTIKNHSISPALSITVAAGATVPYTFVATLLLSSPTSPSGGEVRELKVAVQGIVNGTTVKSWSYQKIRGYKVA